MSSSPYQMLWDHFRQTVGIGLRCVEALPESKLDAHPIPNMRTPKELVVHMFGMATRSVLEGAVAGEIKDLDEKVVVASIHTKADLLRYCNECWIASDRAAKAITDETMRATIKTPWGVELPGFVAAYIPFDEFPHHRGQLYAYLRALGVDVPEMWDFAHNAPEFQPAATAKV